MTHKPLPVAGWNQAIAKGSEERMLLGANDSGVTITLSNSVFTEVFVPAGVQFNNAKIFVGNPRPTSADPESAYEGFLWSDQDPDSVPEAVILAISYGGKDAGVAKLAGESLGFFKSITTGKSVILWARE